jgi:hypothetical protein
MVDEKHSEVRAIITPLSLVDRAYVFPILTAAALYNLTTSN